MNKKTHSTLHAGSKALLILIEVTALLAVLFVGVAGIFLWRLSRSPIDLSVIKPYAEEKLSNPQSGIFVKTDKLLLHWPSIQSPIMLGIEGGSVQSAEKRTILKIKKVGLGVSLPHLLFGKLLVKSLVLEEPAFNLVRNQDGHLNLSFASKETVTLPQRADTSKAQEALLTRVIGYIEGKNLSGEASVLQGLERFEVRNAQASFIDRRSNSYWSVSHMNAELKSAALHRNTTAYLEGTLEGLSRAGEANPKLEVSATIPNSRDRLIAKWSLTPINLAALGRKLEDLDILSQQTGTLSAQGQMVLDQNLMPVSASISAQVPEGKLVLEAYDNEPLSFTGMTLQANYDEKNATLNIEKAAVELESVPVEIQGSIQQKDKGYDIEAEANLKTLNPEEVLNLWPNTGRETGAFEWLTEKLSVGNFTDVNVKAKLSALQDSTPEKRWQTDVHALKAGFEFENMHIDYRHPMLPINQAQGRGSFDYISELLRVNVDQATVGEMSLSNGQVEVAHIVEGGKGVADVNLQLSGGVVGVMKYLEQDPIALNHGYDLDNMLGQAALRVNITLPTHGHVALEDVDIDVRGKLSGVQIPALLKQTDLMHASADVKVTGNDISIIGNGKFADQALMFDYQGFLSSKDKPYKEKIKVSGTASPLLRSALDVDLNSFLSGNAGIKAVYTNYSAQNQQVSIKADLTPTTLFFKPAAFVKAAGDQATADLNVILTAGDIKRIENLNVTGPDLKMTKGTLDFEKGELAEGNAAYIQMGQSNGAIEFSLSKANQLDLTAKMNQIDLRPFLQQEDNQSDDESLAVIASIDATTLLTNKDYQATNGKIYMDLTSDGSFNQLEMDATIGKGSLYLRYKPDENGKRNFRFEADDAGATLTAFGLYDKIKGGQILIHAEPSGKGSDKNLVGVAEISDFQVVGAPTLAKLLSLMSLEGLASGITNDGIAFTRLETRFDWLYQPAGSMLVLEDGRTSGSAIGLTFNGIVNQAKGNIDLSGTIIPVSSLNKVIRSIPLLGEVLTGGSGVFAATYKVTGPTKDPKVSINPLSVLAPGILRRILFE